MLNRSQYRCNHLIQGHSSDNSYEVVLLVMAITIQAVDGYHKGRYIASLKFRLGNGVPNRSSLPCAHQHDIIMVKLTFENTSVKLGKVRSIDLCHFSTIWLA